MKMKTLPKSVLVLNNNIIRIYAIAMYDKLCIPANQY